MNINSQIPANQTMNFNPLMNSFNPQMAINQRMNMNVHPRLNLFPPMPVNPRGNPNPQMMMNPQMNFNPQMIMNPPMNINPQMRFNPQMSMFGVNSMPYFQYFEDYSDQEHEDDSSDYQDPYITDNLHEEEESDQDPQVNSNQTDDDSSRNLPSNFCIPYQGLSDMSNKKAQNPCNDFQRKMMQPVLDIIDSKADLTNNSMFKLSLKNIDKEEAPLPNRSNRKKKALGSKRFTINTNIRQQLYPDQLLNLRDNRLPFEDDLEGLSTDNIRSVVLVYEQRLIENIIDIRPLGVGGIFGKCYIVRFKKFYNDFLRTKCRKDNDNFMHKVFAMLELTREVPDYYLLLGIMWISEHHFKVNATTFRRATNICGGKANSAIFSEKGVFLSRGFNCVSRKALVNLVGDDKLEDVDNVNVRILVDPTKKFGVNTDISVVKYFVKKKNSK
ncbi:tryptophan-rich antigen [Histomonas meleagridis]|uniref:tryptophan-rich antigen n=1 Tax=Histomonas meleagridis TaxID=135588 RepID=UPI00355A564E|nr:tryptophan-rich antigen [Histomonas meleagridis]KAH0804292.1 tryptophan-rich antigen [Histomonas meleagridis]